MGPIAYALCQKAILGPAMWITGLCSFPSLIENVPLPLDAVATVRSSSFTVPVDKNYEFLLEFEFVSTEARLQDKMVGSSYAADCEDNPTSLLEKPEYGHPIPIRVVIRHAVNRAVIVDAKFITLCIQGHAGNRKMRSIGWVTLARGEYTAEVTNLAIQDGFANIKASVSLGPGSGK
jgi:hypothetical protein